jgi:FkbM family methyltransferase
VDWNLRTVTDTTLMSRIVRYPLRILPRNMTTRILQGPLRGKKWVIGSQRHACWLGHYESYLQRVIALEVRPGSVFYDVGANVGFYSLLASTLVASGRVYAFEPLPANVNYLRRHLELNGIQNAEVLEVAICDRVGASFFYEDETRAMGRLQTDGQCFVRTETLDSLVGERRIRPPDYMKMDIEGAELLALRGASQTFRKSRPVLFLAMHSQEMHRECRQLLESWGYVCQVLQGGPLEDRSELVARFPS